MGQRWEQLVLALIQEQDWHWRRIQVVLGGV
jgi:hypothetical protein